MVFSLSFSACTTLLTDSMDVLVDLSRAHFLCTADNLDTIPASLHGSFGGLWICTPRGRGCTALSGVSARGHEPVEKGRRRRALDVESSSIIVESGARNLKKRIAKVCSFRLQIWRS